MPVHNMAFWFGRRKQAELSLQTQLLSELLKLQQAQVQAAASLQAERDKLELEKVRIEVENAKALGEERRTDRAEAAKLRQQQREWAQKARDIKKQKEAAAKVAQGAPANPQGCRVCANPSDATLTVTEVGFHYSGHTGALDLFRQ